MVQCGMLKEEAIQLLGGKVSLVADVIGVSYQAVEKWPDVLPPRIADRVQAALYRRIAAERQAGSASIPVSPEAKAAAVEVRDAA
jgi:hypothetical protein